MALDITDKEVLLSSMAYHNNNFWQIQLEGAKNISN